MSKEKSNVIFLFLLVAGFWIYWLHPWKNQKPKTTPVPRSISMVRSPAPLVVPHAEAVEAPRDSVRPLPLSSTSASTPTESLPDVTLPPGMPQELSHLAKVVASELFSKKAQLYAQNWDQEVYQKLEKGLDTPDEMEEEDYVVVKKYRMKDGHVFHRSEYKGGGVSENVYNVDEEDGGYEIVSGRYFDEAGKLKSISLSASDADVGQGTHSFSFNSDGALTSSYSSFKHYAFNKEYNNGQVVQKTFTIHATDVNPYRPPQEF